jgi:hypothetical protein
LKAAAFSGPFEGASVVDRVTTIPVEVDISSAGICPTSPSPTVASVYISIAFFTAICSIVRPIIRPPTILITVYNYAYYGVALDKLACAVHSAVEISLALNITPALFGVLLAYNAGV